MSERDYPAWIAAYLVHYFGIEKARYFMPIGVVRPCLREGPGACGRLGYWFRDDTPPTWLRYAVVWDGKTTGFSPSAVEIGWVDPERPYGLDLSVQEKYLHSYFNCGWCGHPNSREVQEARKPKVSSRAPSLKSGPVLKLVVHPNNSPFLDAIRLEIRTYSKNSWSDVIDGWDSPLGEVTSAIYALFQNGITLYVGQSVNVRQRLRKHIATRPFCTAFVTPCEPADLDRAEREAIERLDPPWNQRHRSGRPRLSPFMLPPEALK